VAVCCSPNAGRISPYFIQNSWMKENNQTLVATLLMPNILITEINHTKIRIENQTDYPHANVFNLKIQIDKPTMFTLKIRKPEWVKAINTKEKYKIENNYIFIQRLFKENDEVEFSFTAEVNIQEDQNGEKYFTYGSLVFAKPIKAKEIPGRIYAPGFQDFTYQPTSKVKFVYSENEKVSYEKGKIITKLINQETKKKETVVLIPIGKTVLRQTTFK
jgi:hypothetical protein